MDARLTSVWLVLVVSRCPFTEPCCCWPTMSSLTQSGNNWTQNLGGDPQSGYQEEEEIWLSFAPEEVNVYNCKL